MSRTYTKPVRWKRLLWGFLAVVCLAIVIVGIWALRLGNVLKGGMGIGEVYQSFQDPRKLFPYKDRIVVLVLGKDYNRDRKGMPYTKNSRADTIMLLSVDLVSPKISAVSIPRDSKIRGADGITEKANSIMSRGGPQLMIETLSQQFGVTPDYYVVLKPDAVRTIVDSVGGVDVETLDDMNYDDSWGQLHIHIPKGPAHLNGPEAEGFVRFRKTEAGGRLHKGPNLEEGDIRRAARQQQLIHALVEAGLRPANIVNAPSIVEAGFKEVETNLEKPQLVALANLFKQAGGASLASGTLPGEDSTEGGVYYWVLDETRSQRMINWLIRGDQGAARGLPRIVVYNSSKVNGAARTVASMLYSEGYEAVSRWGKDVAPM
ncbi:MAG: polyisoprenyl-teichoic acid--peptidoglycan teichoic acid transferase, partial [Fimbriimonadaceae bacterium]|nr:polyisoprenyl-teichoic acid--peptidoglycan teichoic acid transferase [Fimbriimonadaceae bacterium]